MSSLSAISITVAVNLKRTTFNMTGGGETARANPFKGFGQKIGRIFGKGESVNAPNLINDIVGMSSGILGNPESTHQHSSHDNSEHHSSNHHGNEHHGAHGAYHFSPYFERAVELINAAAGILVIASVLLAGLNLILVAFNANFGEHFYFYRL